jgi:hypothetical protein
MTPLFFAGDEEMDEQFSPVLISASLDFECWICVSSHFSDGFGEWKEHLRANHTFHDPE